MKLLLIQPMKPSDGSAASSHWSLCRPYSLLFLKSYVEQTTSHSCDILDLERICSLSNHVDLHKILEEQDADVFGVTATTTTREVAISIIKMLKRLHPAKMVIVGGVHFMNCDIDTIENLKEVHVVVRGEGEKTLAELLDAISKGLSLDSIKGITFRNNDLVQRNPDQEVFTEIDCLNVHKYSLPHEYPESFFGSESSLGTLDISVDDLDVPAFLENIKQSNPANQVLRGILGSEDGDLADATPEKLASALNKILKMHDYHRKINVHLYEPRLDKATRQLLAEAQGKTALLEEHDYMTLNRALLRAIYSSRFLKTPTLRAVSIMSSRGCPYSCIFCAKSGMKYRHRSTEGVLNEIRYYVHNHGIRAFNFVDLTFTAMPDKARELCQAIISENLDIIWWCETRANIPLQLVPLMARAGCRSFIVGVETGSQKILKTINKGVTLSHVERLAATARENGIEMCCYFMYSHLGEVYKDVLKTLRFMKRLFSKYHVKVAFQPSMIFPGTKLELIAKQKGILPSEFSWSEAYYDEFNLRLGQLSNIPLFIDTLTKEEMLKVDSIYREWDRRKEWKTKYRVISLRRIRYLIQVNGLLKLMRMLRDDISSSRRLRKEMNGSL